ncbi:COG4695 Phage-related protein [uncultured Caudovirales phage]|uniref:COG4695 Phage-related protein n=1 Tax=uncultured Caudovirales phage TaxID=2100421 RepID=A0A6J7WK31_9CAUD|nr:COG4695 Phage-related protein [uncultured Caudovirales phage]
MGIMDRIFGTSKKVQDLQNQVKQLQRGSLTGLISMNTSIFPSYQVFENVETYTTVDDVYSVITLLADTAAKVEMYGYEIISEPSMKSFKKYGQQSLQGKYYRRKALQDLPVDDKFVEFIDSISYEDKIRYYTTLYINGELFLYKEILELGPNAGKVILHPLQNQNVTVVISEEFPQRVLGYKYLDMGFDGMFSPDEVIHIKYYNPTITNGQQWRGLSPLQVLTKRLTRLNAGMDASVGQMQNGGLPGIVYEKSDYAIEALGQRKNDFASYLRNSANKGAPYFAAGEMGYIQMGLSLADMDVASLQQIDFTKLCNAYHVPEVLLNNQDSSTYNNMNTALKMLYTNSIIPNITLLRDGLIKGILPLYNDGVKRTIEIDLSDIAALQEDLNMQAQALNQMWWITPNEKRDMQDFEELDDPNMDRIIIDSGKMLLDDLSPVPDVTLPIGE